MQKPILAVTSRFQPVEARIAEKFEARRKTEGTSFNPEELLAASEGADAVLITRFGRLDADFFRRLSSSVKVISTYSVGIDHTVSGHCDRIHAVGSNGPDSGRCDVTAAQRESPGIRSTGTGQERRMDRTARGCFAGLADYREDPRNSGDGPYRTGSC
jgi:D-isomer specific 2-hydroxyacid dehydrogenase, catalytic domain